MTYTYVYIRMCEALYLMIYGVENYKNLSSSASTSYVVYV